MLKTSAVLFKEHIYITSYLSSSITHYSIINDEYTKLSVKVDRDAEKILFVNLGSLFYVESLREFPSCKISIRGVSDPAYAVEGNTAEDYWRTVWSHTTPFVFCGAVYTVVDASVISYSLTNAGVKESHITLEKP
jgi:hypothetical protein